MDAIKTQDLFDLNHTAAAPLLSRFDYPWQALAEIGAWIKELGKTLPTSEYTRIGEDVWIANSVKRYPGTYIDGPAIIGAGTELRPGAFIRGKVLVGEGCVVGNSTELKNVILFDHVQVPHYNYVGDSILGYCAHMGAGAITSNIKSDKTNVVLQAEGQRIETNLRKFGAMLGDHVEVGCNSVMNPGTIIGRYSRIYPVSMVRGIIPPSSIVKQNGVIVPIQGAAQGGRGDERK